MSADKLHAIGDLPLQGFSRLGFDVLMAEGLGERSCSTRRRRK